MARPTDKYRRDFQALRRAYRAELPQKVRAIREAAEEAGRRGYAGEAITSLSDMVHRLVGSAAIFGFHHLSGVACVLQDHIKTCGVSGSSLEESWWRELAVLVQKLDRAIPGTRSSKTEVDSGGADRDGPPRTAVPPGAKRLP